jgi:hypothetical protein
MNNNWLDVREYKGNGFQPLIVFNSWRVAILNYLDDIHPARNNKMERHTRTDEVFVLMKGRGILLIGGNGSQIDELYSQIMEIGVANNVRQNTWHTVLLSQDASALLVEEQNTGEENTEYFELKTKFRLQIMEIAQSIQLI